MLASWRFLSTGNGEKSGKSRDAPWLGMEMLAGETGSALAVGESGLYKSDYPGGKSAGQEKCPSRVAFLAAAPAHKAPRPWPR
jgi:hypothetical protein